VEGWVKEKGMSVPPTIQSLVALCRNTAGDKLDISRLKVILNKDLWEKCKKARLRLRKEEADQLFRKESDELISVKNTTLKSVENTSMSSCHQKTTSVVGVVGSSSKSLASPLVATEPVKEVDTATAKIPTQPGLAGFKKASSPLGGVNLSPIVLPSPVSSPSQMVTPSPPMVTPSSPMVTPSPPTVTYSPPMVTSSPQMVIPSPTITPSPPIIIPSLPVVTPPPMVTPSPPIVTPSPPMVTPTPSNVIPSVPSVKSPPPTASQPSLVPHASGETHSESNSVTQQDISLATLKLSEINPNVPSAPIEAMEVSEDVVENLTEKVGSSNPATPERETQVGIASKDLPDLLSTASDISSKKISKPAEETVDLTAQKKTPPSAGAEEIIDLTGPQKKLSLKEYQEKLRNENAAVNPEDVKPFEEDDEVEVIGVKEGNAKSSRSGDPPEPPFKKEKPSSVQPQDLLTRRSSGDVVVEGAVKAPPPNPIMVFKHRVTDGVKIHLLNYYAKDAKDRQHKDGRMKEIKIRNDQEFMNYCRTFSKKFQKDIFEAHVAINGSEEGIEMVDVRQYGIGHDIDKFFSEVKI